jgi:signal transduction histidine kinase/ActR/RegA family two-component response regulator
MDRLLAAAFAHAPVGMAILEPVAPFHVRYANALFTRVTRTRGPRADGVPFLELLPPSTNASLRLPLARVAESGGTEGVLETDVTRGQTLRHVEFTLTRLDDPDERGVLILARDVSEREEGRRHLEHECDRLRAVGGVNRQAGVLAETELTARAAVAASLVCEGPAAVYLLADDGAIIRAATHRFDPKLSSALPTVLPPDTLSPIREGIVAGKRVSASYAMTLRPLERALFRLARASWLMVTPVRGRRAVLGALVSIWRRPHLGPPEDLQAIDAIAAQIALGIDNARFFAASEGERRRLDLILEQIPDTVWIVDVLGGVQTNSTGRELLELGHADPLPSLRELRARVVARDDAGQPTGAGDFGLGDALAGREVLGTICTLAHTDGIDRWLLCSASPLRDERGQLIGAVGATSDMTSTRRANERLRLLASASAILAASLDYQKTLADVARLAVPTLADWCVVDVVDGGNVLRLPVAHADDRRAAVAEVLQGLAPGPQARAQIEAEDGRTRVTTLESSALVALVGDERCADVMAAFGPTAAFLTVPLRTRQRTLGMMHFIMAESGRRFEDGDRGTAEDIAYRAALAVDNGRLYQEAREADRRKDEFLAVLSHELRTPLAPLMTWVELLRRAPDPARTRHAAEVIERNVRVQRALINELLDLATITRGKVWLDVKPVNVADVLRAAAETLADSAREKNVRLECHVRDDDLPVEGDPTRLEQIFWNLLSNAIKFTPPAGVVTATAQRDSDWVVVRIADTGIGITPAFLPQVFEMFKQQEEGARRSHGGLGIGLALAKRLTELHRGVIQATSPGLGRGAEFVVRIPLHGDASEPILQTPRTVDDNGRPLDGLTVLVVEDAADTREAMHVMFEQLGARVTEAEHGGVAFERLEGALPDVVLCDLRMPVMDGYELIRHLRSDPRHATLPVVAVSGFASEDSFRKARQAGFDAYVSKPFEYEALVAAVQQAIAERRSAASERASR